MTICELVTDNLNQSSIIAIRRELLQSRSAEVDYPPTHPLPNNIKNQKPSLDWISENFVPSFCRNHLSVGLPRYWVVSEACFHHSITQKDKLSLHHSAPFHAKPETRRTIDHCIAVQKNSDSGCCFFCEV